MQRSGQSIERRNRAKRSRGACLSAYPWSKVRRLEGWKVRRLKVENLSLEPSNLRPSNLTTPHRRAFTMAEVIISIVVVGTLVTASLSTLGASAKGAKLTDLRGRGTLLAQQLLSEILTMPYADTNEPALFGPELTETSGSRDTYDDVDDYHNYSPTSAEYRDGSVMSLGPGWRRSVSVVWVTANNLALSSAVDTGIKRITVTTTYMGKLVGKVVGYRTGSPLVLEIFELPMAPMPRTQEIDAVTAF